MLRSFEAKASGGSSTWILRLPKKTYRGMWGKNVSQISKSLRIRERERATDRWQ